MAFRKLSDIDRELDSLGEVPPGISEIAAKYRGEGLDLDKLDEILEELVRSVGLRSTARSGRRVEIESRQEPERAAKGSVDREDREPKPAVFGSSGEAGAETVTVEQGSDDEGVEEFEQATESDEEIVIEASEEEETVSEPDRGVASGVPAGAARYGLQSEPKPVPAGEKLPRRMDFGEVETAAGREEVPGAASEPPRDAWSDVGRGSDMEDPQGEPELEAASEEPDEQQMDTDFRQLLELDLDPSEFPQSEPPSAGRKGKIDLREQTASYAVEAERVRARTRERSEVIEDQIPDEEIESLLEEDILELEED